MDRSTFTTTRVPSPGISALLFALLIVLAMAIAALHSWTIYGREADEVEATRSIVHATHELFGSLRDAETGQRGFLLTGDEAYLEPYRRAVQRIPNVLNTLAAFVAADRPDQAQRVERLKPLVKEKLDELEYTIALRRGKGFAAALEVVRTDHGETVMDGIRVVCEEMETSASARLTELAQRSRSSADQAGLVATVGGIALFVLLVAATSAIRRGNARRQELIDALAKSEAEALLSRDSLQTTLASIGDAVIATDASGNITFMNAVAQSLTGWTAQDAAGLSLDRVFVIQNEDTGAMAENPVTKVLREGRVVDLANHTKLIAKDGRQIPIDDSAAPIRDIEGGNILGVVLVFRDVGSRRAAERDLNRSAERIRALFNASPIGVIAGDVYGRVNEANDAFLAITGYTREELTAGKANWETITPPEWLAADHAGIAEAREHGTCPPYEKEYIRRDGTRVPVYVGFTLVGEDRNESLAFIIDATEIKRAQRSLVESHERFQRLFDANVVGILTASETRVIDANQAYLDMLGCSRQHLEAGTVDWKKLTPPEMLERDIEAIRQLRERGYCTPFEKEYLREDGSRIPILIGAAVLTYEPELTWVCFVADLSRQKALESELQRANQRLSESNQELQRFAYIVAHDLQAPLRTVSSMTALLTRRLKGQLDADLEEIAGHIQQSAGHLSRLISDLLDYSRTTSGPRSTGEPIDCSVLFSWTVMNLQSQIRETGANVTAGPLPKVQADDQLVRVFQNLIDNALKYRSERLPGVYVEANLNGDEWVFSVRDNGIGFEMQYADRIFGVFQRLHGMGEYEGTGIGLAISKRLIERYGGRMWAESEPGVGSTFYFTLPAYAVSDEAVRSAEG